MRCTLGLVLLSWLSTLAEVTPNSSASSMALSVQRTTLNQLSSPWRTIGPSGLLAIFSSRIT
ncbi:hypothetical protein ACH58_08985 [Achromobacter xylosoxidans]|nr:hypothetical protein ACH58_08985 [Achromobacter xylosoxidans]